MKALVAVHLSEQKSNLWTELQNYLCYVMYCRRTLGICVHISVKVEPGNPRFLLCTLQKHHCDSLAERERITINFMTDYLFGGPRKIISCQPHPLLFHMTVGYCLPPALFLV